MVPQAKYDSLLMKRAIEDKSGYPFELQVTRRIEAWGDGTYVVEPNYSFEDQDTGEARELDFHAIRAIPISVEKDEFAFVVVLGSCKVSRNPYIFFTRSERLADAMLVSDVPLSGFPLEICEEPGETTGIEWYFQLHKLLHIGRGERISSQACVLSWHSGKWVIEKESVIRDTFVPLAKVMSREIEDHNDDCIPGAEGGVLSYQMYYPLLVLKGPMYEYYVPENGDGELKDTKHIVVVRHYQSKTVKCRYGIDVIHESYLEEYLGLVDKEGSKFVNLIRRHKRVVAKSIKELCERAKEKSPEDGGQKDDRTT